MCIDKYGADAIIALYNAHPCNAPNVLKRLASGGSGRLPAGLTAHDLAEDPSGDRTDQNHVGAVAFVYALAEAASIDADSEVLDLGCGLGGSARLLAARYGCRVDGLDISPRRVKEGNELTQLVGLENRVVLYCADLRDHPVGKPRYTHLWAQGVWVHIGDKRGVLQRWLNVLQPGGRIAMEDSYQCSIPVSPAICADWQRLSHIWMAEIPSLAGWRAIFEPETHVMRADDLTPALIDYFAQLVESPATFYTEQERLERESWRRAIELAQSGVLGYIRLIAERPDNPPSADRGDI